MGVTISQRLPHPRGIERFHRRAPCCSSASRAAASSRSSKSRQFIILCGGCIRLRWIFPKCPAPRSLSRHKCRPVFDFWPFSRGKKVVKVFPNCGALFPEIHQNGTNRGDKNNEYRRHADGIPHVVDKVSISSRMCGYRGRISDSIFSRLNRCAARTRPGSVRASVSAQYLHPKIQIQEQHNTNRYITIDIRSINIIRMPVDAAF